MAELVALVLVCPRDHSGSLYKRDGNYAEEETSGGPWAEARKLADDLNHTLLGIVKEAGAYTRPHLCPTQAVVVTDTSKAPQQMGQKVLTLS
jgi:hypothetical protein